MRIVPVASGRAIFRGSRPAMQRLAGKLDGWLRSAVLLCALLTTASLFSPANFAAENGGGSSAGVSAELPVSVTGQAGPVSVSLVSEYEALVAGRTQTVAVRLHPDDGWHTYWRNPGDTGLPTRVDWQLPDGVTAGAIQWPVPERIDFDGLIDLLVKQIMVARSKRDAGNDAADD